MNINAYLRALSASQQVQILFSVVFGVLVIVTLWHFIAQLPQADDPRSNARTGHARALLRSSWWMMTVFWVSWALGNATAIVLFALVSLLALREFITLSPTQRSDHRSLILAFFVVLPVQYALVATRSVALFSVFIPVYVFLALPALSALANDPKDFLERNAQLQWGIMVCVYGMSHVPALLLLQYPGFRGRSAFLVFFLVVVVQCCMLVQHLVARRCTRCKPMAPAISSSFQWPSWLAGVCSGGVLGGLLAAFTPLNPGRGLAMGLIACVAGSLGHLVMKAIKRDRGVTSWGNVARSTSGAGGLLDRVDALCFAAPVFFHALQWVYPAK